MVKLVLSLLALALVLTKIEGIRVNGAVGAGRTFSGGNQLLWNVNGAGGRDSCCEMCKDESQPNVRPYPAPQMYEFSAGNCFCYKKRIGQRLTTMASPGDFSGVCA